jgi:hypothetical protein
MTATPQGIPAEYANAHETSQQNLTGTAVRQPAKPLVGRPGEDDMHAYARHTRNATVFIAWIVGILTLFSVIVGIVTAIALTHLVASVSPSGGSGSDYTCVYDGTC